MRILVCGGRNFLNETLIREFLKSVSRHDPVIISGGCRGADKIAETWADRLGYKRKIYPAQWDKYGRSAGPIRNKKMLKEGNPDLVVGFHEKIESSKGTKHMVSIADKEGVETEVYSTPKIYVAPGESNIPQELLPSKEARERRKEGFKKYVKRYIAELRCTYKKNQPLFWDLLRQNRVLRSKNKENIILAKVLGKLGARYMGRKGDDH